MVPQLSMRLMRIVLFSVLPLASSQHVWIQLQYERAERGLRFAIDLVTSGSRQYTLAARPLPRTPILFPPSACGAGQLISDGLREPEFARAFCSAWLVVHTAAHPHSLATCPSSPPTSLLSPDNLRLPPFPPFCLLPRFPLPSGRRGVGL